MTQLAQPGPNIHPTPELRSHLTILTGFHPTTTAMVTATLLATDENAIAVTYDITQLLTTGALKRTVRNRDAVLEKHQSLLEHACLACATREDIIPTLARLATEYPGSNLLLHLPPSLEADNIAAACTWHEIGEQSVRDYFILERIVAIADPETFLSDLDSAEDLTDRGLEAAEDDSRSVSEVVVRQIETADNIILCEHGEPDFENARVHTLLQRLNPWARHNIFDSQYGSQQELAGLLAASPRRQPTHPPLHARGIEGYQVGQHEPEADCGIVSHVYRARRPFHPGRLNAAFPRLTGHYLRGRGHLWIASQPGAVLVLEASGGGISMGQLGVWLADGDEEDWEEASAERRAWASFAWDEDYGDRDTHLSFVGINTGGVAVEDILDPCLLTDAEISGGMQNWAHLTDPFSHCFDSH